MWSMYTGGVCQAPLSVAFLQHCAQPPIPIPSWDRSQSQPFNKGIRADGFNPGWREIVQPGLDGVWLKLGTCKN